MKPSCDIHASYSRGCSECNRVYHAALNAALARAMGTHVWMTSADFQGVRWMMRKDTAQSIASRHSSVTINPDGSLPIDWERSDFPDFCNDPAASHELKLWMVRQDDAVRARFDDAIEHAVAPYGGFTILDVLLTPLPTIAQAAAVALGLEVSND